MSSRVSNANLAESCAFCGEAFPRMYKTDDGVIVCKLGGVCRNGEEQEVVRQKIGEPLADVEKSLKVRVGTQKIGRIDCVPLKTLSGAYEYRAYIAHPEGWVQVGVGTNLALALKLIGNAVMRKLWED